MIEALEKLLSDLERDFDNLGIAYVKGQEFDMAEFGLNNHEHSKVAFYDPAHCDGINSNPELQNTIANSNSWVDATNHEYPKNVGRALYNSTLRALWMTKNPGKAATGIKTHKDYIDTNHRYLDTQKVETRGPVGEGIPSVSLTRAPLVVDPITEKFGKSYQQFLTVIANDPDPFKDAKANCYVPGGASMMDAGTPKTIGGFQTTLFTLNERLAIYNARKNENLLNDESFVTASNAASEKTIALTQTTNEIANKYNPFFDTAKQVERKIDGTKLSEMNMKQKEQFIKETIAQLEELKKSSITQEAIQRDIDTLTIQYRTLTNNNTVALPCTPSYQAILYASHNVSDCFHNAERDTLQEIHHTISKLKGYKDTLAQIVSKQETQLKKLHSELIETAPQLVNKIESIKFSVNQLNELIQNDQRLSLSSTQFDAISKRISWDDEITQLAQLKQRLINAKNQLSSQDPDQPINEALFKELSQILAWSPADKDNWNYVTQPAGYAETGKSYFWSAMSSFNLSQKQKSRTELLQDEINKRLENVSVDPNRKKTELETKEATLKSDLTSAQDSLSLLQKYFGKKGEATTYLNNREKQYSFYDSLQSMTKFFRHGPTEKEKRRNFFSEIGEHIQHYEQDRNPEHLRSALRKINAMKKTEQFKPRSDFKNSMRSVLNKMSWDINEILDKNTLHTQYFHPEHGKVGVLLDILRKNDHWKHSSALSKIEAINASTKEYGHDQDVKRINNTLAQVNDLLNHWTEHTPASASHINTIKFTLETLKTELENRALLIKYLGNDGVFAKSMEHYANDNVDARLQRIDYLADIGELIEKYTHDKNPTHLDKINEKIDAVTLEGSALFAEDRANGQHCIHAILAKLKDELTQAHNSRANRIEQETREHAALRSESPRMAMLD